MYNSRNSIITIKKIYLSENYIRKKNDNKVKAKSIIALTGQTFIPCYERGKQKEQKIIQLINFEKCQHLITTKIINHPTFFPDFTQRFHDK